MAKIGLKHFKFGILHEAQDGTATYEAGQTLAKAVSCNVAITNNSAKLYANDGLAESDTSFQSGTVTLGIDNDDLQTLATLLGHSYSAETGIVRSANDTAPYVGLGRIVTRITNGVRNWKVEMLMKCKFSEPSEENNTRGESVEFGTTEIEGTVAALADGSWSKAEVFTTESAAQTYLDALFNTYTPPSP